MDPSQPRWLFFLFGHVLDLQIPIVTGYGYLLNTPILLSSAVLDTQNSYVQGTGRDN